MTCLSADESCLTGSWSVSNGRMVEDEVCRRINELIDTCLTMIGSDQTGWEILYKDPSDGRLWILTYPQASMQGGGPPKLCCASIDEVKGRFELISKGGL